MSSIYYTYLTTYTGSKLPMWYIGSTSIEKINSGYHGSVKSKKYKTIWESELKSNPHLFKTKIISNHQTRKESLEKELKLQKSLNVVKSSMYINQSLATINGYFGMSVFGENHPRFGVKHTNKTKQKIKDLHHDVSGSNNPMYGKLGENNPKSLLFWAIDPNGQKYIAKGINDFARKHNLISPNITEVLKGRRSHHKKWTFGYI